MSQMGTVMHNSPSLNSPWLIRRRSCPEAKMRLFCFPYAGGNAQVFQTWAELLSPSIEIIAIEAPGKGRRLLEAPCRTLDALCAELIPILRPILPEKPYSFFGHSNGAVVAFELASQLHRLNAPLPQMLLLSASPAPWAYAREKPYSQMTDDEFKMALRDFNATPEKLLNDEGVYKLLSPGMRADFSLAEQYHYRGDHPLPVKTHIYHGEFDEVTEQQLRNWQENILEPLSYERIAGGHFFIHTHVDQLTQSISKRCEDSAQESRHQGLEHV